MRTLSGVAGTVTIDSRSAPASRGSWGTVHVRVDARFADPADDTRVFHVVGDYDAALTTIG